MADQLKDRVINILDDLRPATIVNEDPPLKAGDDPPPEADDSKIESRWFALGLFLVSIFLVSLAGVLPTEDRSFWAACASVIAVCSGIVLILAAWRWDRSRTHRRRK